MDFGGKYIEHFIHSPLPKLDQMHLKVAALFAIALLVVTRPSIAQTFHPIVNTITPMTNANAMWADLNNDQLPDLIVAGLDQTGISSIIWYESNGDSTFNAQEIARLSQVVFDLADYDRDGYIDLLVAGKTSSDEKVLRVYRNNNGLSFTDQECGLAGLTQGDVLWVDLNHDLTLEIVASGLDMSGKEKITLYRQTGSGYQLMGHSMTSVAYGRLIDLDANNDGLKEIVVSGYDALGNPSTTIYTIDENLTFSVYYEGIDGYSQNVVVKSDNNADGFEDLVISGITNDLEKATNLYLNNQTNGFIREISNLDSISNTALTVGDLSNDGRSDLLLMGLDHGSNPVSGYYANTGLEGISRWIGSSDDFEPLFSGSFSLADFNLDGSLDVFQIGNSTGPFQANLYSSDIHLTQPNHLPTAPTGLISVTEQNQATFAWSASSDDLTATESLSYNVYISREAGGADLVLSPMSSVGTGYRRIFGPGNAGYSTQMTVNRLPEGRYYWSVQAVDNAYKGSAFAVEEEFVICDPFSLGADTTVCFEEVITLAAGESGDAVNWYSLANDEILAMGVLSYDHLVSEKDTLVAELTKDDLGCILYDTIIIDVAGPVEVDLCPDITVCRGDSAHFELPGFDAVNWYSLNSGPLKEDQDFIKVQVIERDTVVAEVIYGSCTQVDSVIVDVYTAPVVHLPGDTSICAGQTLALSLDGFEMVNWYLEGTGLVLADSGSFQFTVTGEDRVIAEGIDGHGCSGFDTLNVSALPLPEIDLGRDTSLCHGKTLELQANGFEEVEWYSTKSGWLAEGPDFTFEGPESDTIIVEVSNAQGCQNSDTLVIEVLPLPLVDLGPDLVVCEGERVLLEQQDLSFERVDWFDISGSSLVVDQWFYSGSFFETDTLVAQVTNINGCMDWDTVIVNVEPLPIFQLRDTAVCYGSELQFSADGDWDKVNWLTEGNLILAEGQQEFSFTAEESMTIRVEVYQNGCFSYDTIMVTVHPLPSIDLEDVANYCVGDSILLDPGNDGITYDWMNINSEILSDQQVLKTVADVSQQLFLQVTNEEECIREDSISVIVNPLPDVDILGETEVCANEPVHLSFERNEFKSATWFTETGQTPGLDLQNLEYAPPASQMVYLRIEDQNNCFGLDSTQLTVHPSPGADAGPDQFICYGTEIQIGGDYESENLQFLWEDIPSLSAFTLPNPIASPKESTWYHLNVRDANDCYSVDSTFVQVHPQIIANAGPDQILCEGESVTIGENVSHSDNNYQWFPASGLSSPNIPNPSVSIGSDQTYVLSVFSGDCGPVYDTVYVTVKPKPEVAITPTQSISPASSVRLEASGGVSYRWEPAELLDNPTLPDPIATPLSTTLFTVDVENEFGCSVTDSVKILIQNVLFIPNLFTPNGDGSNDEFRIYGSGIRELQLSIYDQNGVLIHTISDPEEALSRGWDGTKDGRMQENGTFIWTVKGHFSDGSRLEYKGAERGIIQLLR